MCKAVTFTKKYPFKLSLFMRKKLNKKGIKCMYTCGANFPMIFLRFQGDAYFDEPVHKSLINSAYAAAK